MGYPDRGSERLVCLNSWLCNVAMPSGEPLNERRLEDLDVAGTFSKDMLHLVCKGDLLLLSPHSCFVIKLPLFPKFQSLVWTLSSNLSNVDLRAWPQMMHPSLLHVGSGGAMGFNIIRTILSQSLRPS